MSELFDTSPIVLGLNVVLVWLLVQILAFKTGLDTKATMVIPIVAIFLGLNFIEFLRIQAQQGGYR